MVFGIGEGKIEIVLPKTSYVEGEIIKGKLVLTLNQPKKAKELRVELKAERKVWKTRVDSKGSHRYQKTEVLYGFVLPLKGEGEFTSSEYDFELTVPNLGMPVQQNTIAIAGLSIGIGGGEGPVQWFVSSSLDLPLSFDISKRVQIQVSPAVQQKP